MQIDKNEYGITYTSNNNSKKNFLVWKFWIVDNQWPILYENLRIILKRFWLVFFA
jgi:hypothetical protein